MNDREFERQKRRVIRLMVKWRELMRLDGWRDDLMFRDRERDDVAAAGGLYTVGMDTTVAWPYRKYLINVYLPCFPHKTDDEVEELVVHELMHVMLGPLEGADVSTAVMESVTTDLEMALLYAHRGHR